MDEQLDEFYNLFKQHLKNNKQAQIRLAYCKDIDWEEKTMTAVGESDNLEYFDVSLGFGYMVIKPKINAECIIGIIEGEEAIAFLIDASEVEEVIYNGGKNGGLCNVPALKKELNKLTARVDGIMDALKQSAVAPQDGGATYKLNITKALALLVNKENFGEIEDVKIKH